MFSLFLRGVLAAVLHSAPLLIIYADLNDFIVSLAAVAGLRLKRELRV